MAIPVVLGADDQTVYIKIVDSTDFSPETGVTSASAGLALWYRKGPTGAVTAITESDLAAVDSAHSDGGMKHLSDGVYRLDLPDAAIPTIENEITVVDGAVTSMQVLGCSLVGVQSIGAPAGASVSADIAAIEAQTDDIGAAGAGLTAIPWNASWDAEVESEVDDALGGGTGTALTAIPWNASWDAEVQSEAADALTAYAPSTATTVWAYSTRTLTSSASSVTGLDGTTLTEYRGDKWSRAITGLGAMTSYANVWFTVKESYEDTDANALVQIDSDTGLLRLNGAAGTAAQGSVTVDNATTGDITVVLKAVASAQLPLRRDLYYDVQWLDASGDTHTLTRGKMEVAGDVTRTTS